MKRHIMAHRKVDEAMAKEIAVWTQHEGPISACAILDIPVPTLHDILDNASIRVNHELFIDEGGCNLRPITKKDVVDYVLESFPKNALAQAGEKARFCVDSYSSMFCKLYFNVDLSA